ncbi:Heat shock protein 22 [Chionoecetes opilio]|uniref:Heat shock protein 22 n=1 Tax=Chionoecetes opilio TaxID=41210 RepID=A0A8J4Y4W7_CHIOP|nr:Heat shock protein 22 [Chionoecetes opilio]
MSLASSMLGEGLRLPISRRGLFFKDDFFSGFQDDYKSAVEDVLDRWRSRSSAADRFASYRKLRERDASDDNQAATISETPDNYVIVLDMGKYSGGQITVETQGFSAVVKGGAGDLTYHRKFPLPKDTNTERVVADLSDEGILTVSAPRKEKEEGSKGPSRSSSKESSLTRTSSEERVIPTTKEGLAINAATQRTQQEFKSSGRKGSNTRIIPLTFEDDIASTGTASASASHTSQAGEATRSFEKIIPTVREGDASPSSQRKTSTQHSSSSSSSVQSRVLPIKRRGRFFQDSTFENVWDDFESAVEDLVAKQGPEKEDTPKKEEDDQIQAYRNLRKVIKEEDNQAATVSKEEDGYKIVMDVKDFADGLLDVKALAGSVMVTGEKGTNSFERRFSIPDLSEPEKVAAALSADGVLTITAPL